jgi:hypothetical protein
MLEVVVAIPAKSYKNIHLGAVPSLPHMRDWARELNYFLVCVWVKKKVDQIKFIFSHEFGGLLVVSLSSLKL